MVRQWLGLRVWVGRIRGLAAQGREHLVRRGRGRGRGRRTGRGRGRGGVRGGSREHLVPHALAVK